MKIALNRLHYPVTTLGYGRRIGIWTQGCSIHCSGCTSRDTWDPSGGTLLDISELVKTCMPWMDNCDGVTITGGEPFDQPETLSVLLAEMRARQRGDILVFTGYPACRALKQPIVVKGLIDVIITGPYKRQAGQTLTLRGSDNQEIFLLTDLAQERYPPDINKRKWETPRRLDWFLSGNDVFMAGIPEPGWGKKFRATIRKRGLICRTSEQSHKR